VLITIAIAFSVVLGFELLLALSLEGLPRMGRSGRALSERCTRAPGLDLVVALITWVPWVVAPILAGWGGILGCLVGQVAAVLLWIRIHELIHREAARGPRLKQAHDRVVGRWSNHLALWFSVPAVPLFWGVRLAQVFLYPPLRGLTGFPRYRHRDWINVTRQKYEGLVGHDLIWCLYCDWMTGVYALGGEMLRNVESFWCPIRFYDGKKCDNCRIDFPDLDEWVPAGAGMEAAQQLLLDRYGGEQHGWFGHPARLTVEGAEPHGTGADDSADDRPPDAALHE
jgi:hypothetical protein